MENNKLIGLVFIVFVFVGCAAIEPIPEPDNSGRVFMDKSVASINGSIPDGAQVVCSYSDVDRSLRCIAIEKFFVESFVRSGYTPKF
jgi:hypothetical protein